MEYKWIELSCEPCSDLNWERQLEEARGCEKQIIWYFKLGLEDPFFPLEDEMRFNALALALQRFAREVWPVFAGKTLGMSLYRGAVPRFSIYFQMLAHKLPDEVPIWLLFDVEEVGSKVEAVRLVSQDGFEHFRIALRGMDLPIDGYRWDEEGGVGMKSYRVKSRVGAVYPIERGERFEAMLGREEVKVVFEKFLTEQWDGLDKLLVLKETVSIKLNRMLQGFEAAGGVVELV